MTLPCLICLEESGIVETNYYYCGCVFHYHRECILQWADHHEGECPMCRRAFAVKKPVVITESGDVVIEVMNPVRREEVAVLSPSSGVIHTTKCAIFAVSFLCVMCIAASIVFVLMTLRII